MVQSRVQWLQEGEKPSKFFCSLENKNYIEKTIKQIQISNGLIVYDQKEILNVTRDFYAQLFASRDSEIENVNLDTLAFGDQVRKLNVV